MVICMSLHQTLDLALLLLTLIVLARTLLWVKAYTKAAQEQAKHADTTARAAVEQMPRPMIRILPLPPTLGTMINGVPVNPSPTVIMQNVGTAAAINLRYQIRLAGSLTPEMFEAPDTPVLPPGETRDTGYPKTALTEPTDFIAEYESPGGARYRYRAVIVEKTHISGERYERIAES
jgi:hypothetical protein